MFDRIGQSTFATMSKFDLYSIGWIAIIVCGVLLLFLFEPKNKSSFPKYPRYRSYYTYQFKKRTTPDLSDVAQQLHAVMGASFEKQRVLSNSEFRVFRIVETEIAVEGRGYRVFAQTSLGEVLRSQNGDAFRSINSKRVDILIVDQGGWPVAAIEHQGSGHYQGTAAARDAVKKEALRKAGVRYIEVSETDSEEQIRSRVREYLGWPDRRADVRNRFSN